MAESEMSMKLLVDKNEKRVLFGEVGKDCVDFLLFILSLPVSTLIRLVGKQQMGGSVANLYESVEKLNESYIQQNISKDTLLKPAAAPHPGYSVPLLTSKTAPQLQASTDKIMYRCSKKSQQRGLNKRRTKKVKKAPQARCYYLYISDDPRAICPDCGSAMSSTVIYVEQQEYSGSSSGEAGFVKGVVTYMVTDDLVIKPISASVSSITLLMTQFNIKDVAAMEEKVVNFGINEAVKLLKAALVSKKVLTDVFLDPNN